MSDSQRPSGQRAVFLSYTSDDLAVALAVCEALREAGIEVWMDQSELQGGDAWDANIRRQIRECALIIPIVSAKTQARREGYFRLEWRLADERMQLVAEGTPLILPVVADDTRQADALVPKSFLTVQWSRLPHGHVPPALVVRVRKLLGMETTAAPANVAPVAIPTEPGAAVRMETADGVETQQPPSRRVPLSMAVTAAVVASLVVGVAVWKLRPVPAPEPRPIVRFAQNLPPNVGFRSMGRTVIALSPDGRSFVYSTAGGLFIRNLEAMEARVIPGTEQSLINSPVFSPDGQSIAFFSIAGSELRRISINGGASLPTGAAENPSGLSWENDGTLLYGQLDGIWRVPAAGGKPERIIPAEADERLSAPQMLPGGKTVLFSSVKLSGEAQIEVRSLSGGARKVVLSGGQSARYIPMTGHLVYVVESALFGIAFDAERLATMGSPVPLMLEVRLTVQTGMANYAISRDGTLLYLTGVSLRRVPVWVDRQGKEEPLKLEPGAYLTPRLSPDGTKLVIAELLLPNRGLLVWDLAGETRTRLTLGGSGGILPLWSPDGTRIIYSSGDGRMMVKTANNTRPPDVLVNPIEGKLSRYLMPAFFTPDGRNLVFGAAGDVGLIPIEATGKPTWLLNSPRITEESATLSPDGRWMAYSSDESGRFEVYVSPFPKVAEDRMVVSTEGGRSPLWSHDGKELFYLGGTLTTPRFMVAAVKSEGGKFTVVSRNPVWNSSLQSLAYLGDVGSRAPNYDVSRDDQRFLMLKEVRPAGAADTLEQVFVVQNWTEELKRRVPGARK